MILNNEGTRLFFNIETELPDIDTNIDHLIAWDIQESMSSN